MNKRFRFVIVFFLVVLAMRLLFAFSTPSFSDDESYFSLRQVEHITETGLPLYDDPLSYGGKQHAFSPLFYYLLAFFNLFLPITIIAKLIPNMLAASVMIFTYLISLELTKNQKVALFTSMVSPFVPVFFASTINSVTPFTLVLPLVLAIIYCFMRSEDKRFVTAYMILLLALSITHVSVFVLMMGFIVFLLLLKLEKLKQSVSELEIGIFSVFFVFWSQFIIFKQAILELGPRILVQNIPVDVTMDYMRSVSPLDIINQVGILTIFFGVYIIYKYLFIEKKRDMYLIFSFLLIVFLLIYLRLVLLEEGLILAGILLVILFSQYLKLLLLFIQKSKFGRFENYFLGGLALLFLLTSVVPSIYYAEQDISKSFNQTELEAVRWIKENTDPGSTILSSYREGSFISYHAQRKNVVDSNFLLVDDIHERFEDVRNIYTTQLATTAIELLNKYDVDYIYVSPENREHFGIEKLAYVEDTSCFRPVYEDDGVKVIRTTCRLTT